MYNLYYARSSTCLAVREDPFARVPTHSIGGPDAQGAELHVESSKRSERACVLLILCHELQASVWPVASIRCSDLFCATTMVHNPVPQKSSKELENAVYDDWKRKAVDAAKKRAVGQYVDYDTFKNMVLVAHLKPIGEQHHGSGELVLKVW